MTPHLRGNSTAYGLYLRSEHRAYMHGNAVPYLEDILDPGSVEKADDLGDSRSRSGRLVHDQQHRRHQEHLVSNH